ncbi:unnamed protein product [Tetraodon nigroviridis]|uniref:(spotted green pufferfish) hypothetical protein n=1 Tax=Tetraodon nigroviridis TaxID=99883 RepID=Q4RT03_TETNG|nr:unnamed protein product [Tetraodon nigroviridis]
MGVKECERGLKNERLEDKKADAGEGENREAGLLSPFVVDERAYAFFIRGGTPRKAAKRSNPGLRSADTSGPTLLSDSGCLISTPDRSSGPADITTTLGLFTQVREILGQCSCPAQFPMIKVSEGKYKVGDSSALIFIRVLRTHVMVRVGGGWDTLEHYLDKHDPCRCAAFGEITSRPSSSPYKQKQPKNISSQKMMSPSVGLELVLKGKDSSQLALQPSGQERTDYSHPSHQEDGVRRTRLPATHTITPPAQLGPHRALAPHRNWSGPEQQGPEEDDVNPGLQMLPTIDPQREQDLYRSFEAEFLANSQQARGALARVPGAATPQGSSLNVGAKVGALPDLRESKRTNPSHLPLDDPLHVLYGNSFGGAHQFGQGEQWRECRGGLKKLPAISGSTEDRDLSSYLAEPDSLNQVPSQPAVNCRNMNGDHQVLNPKVGITDDEGKVDWGTEHIGGVPLENHQKNSPYDMANCDGSDDLPPPEACPSPVPFPPSEDCSFQDSSSESSSMCFSLSESQSESPQPSSPVANGDALGEALSAKKGQKKGDKLDSLTKHKPPAKIRPRIDNRPENCPTRIPTPVSYRDLQVHQTLSPSCTPPLSPQCSRPSARTTSCNILHPAFADMIRPQKHSPPLGKKKKTTLKVGEPPYPCLALAQNTISPQQPSLLTTTPHSPLYSSYSIFNTPPSPNIPKASQLGSICTQTKLFITKGMVFNDNFAINSMYFFLNQGTCEIIFADRDKQSVCAAALLR